MVTLLYIQVELDEDNLWVKMGQPFPWDAFLEGYY